MGLYHANITFVELQLLRSKDAKEQKLLLRYFSLKKKHQLQDHHLVIWLSAHLQLVMSQKEVANENMSHEINKKTRWLSNQSRFTISDQTTHCIHLSIKLLREESSSCQFVKKTSGPHRSREQSELIFPLKSKFKYRCSGHSQQRTLSFNYSLTL